MMTRLPVRARRRQRGVAAVEAAVLLPLLLVLLVFPLFFGRIFWHYAVLQKAAHDAARYLATVPLVEMNNPARGPLAADLARAIATTETAELYAGENSPVSITVLCDDGNCDAGLPATVSVLARTRMYDPFFGSVTKPIFGEDGLLLRAKVVMRYVGQ